MFPWWPRDHGDQLDAISNQLAKMRKEIHHMSDQMAELQDAIATLVSDAQAAVASVTALIDKIQAGVQTEDLSDEIQAVKDASAALEGSTSSADNVLNPPPAEEPVVNPE
jgi:phage shock protein A